MITAALVIASGLAREDYSLAGSQLVMTKLSNGLVIAIAHHKSEFEYFAVFHRGGLLDDRFGETQWSHLIEHLVVRQTDALDDVFISKETPPELPVQPNGETGGHVLRLEALFRVADAKPLAVLKSRATPWTQLQVATQHADSEAARAIQELDFAQRTGFAHKWALAAWNQARRGATTVSLRGAITGVETDPLGAAASRLRARRPPLVLFHGGIETDHALAFAKDIPVAAPEAGVGDPARDEEPLPNPTGTATWDLAVTAIVGACEIPADTPTARLAGLLASELLGPGIMRARDARELRNPLIAFEAADGAPTGTLLLTSAVPQGGTTGRTMAALQRTISALAKEIADDPESVAENLETVRRRSFHMRAYVKFGGELANAPHSGAQVSIDAAYHRLLLGVDSDGELEAAYREYDPEIAGTELADSLAPERWSWLALEPGK